MTNKLRFSIKVMETIHLIELKLKLLLCVIHLPAYCYDNSVLRLLFSVYCVFIYYIQIAQTKNVTINLNDTTENRKFTVKVSEWNVTFV